MWGFRSAVILIFFLGSGHQALDIGHKNKDNIISCIDSCHPLDCSDVSSQGLTSDGVYLIYPGGASSPPVPVYCDMSSAGGPWMVFQKRFDGSVDFYRGWEDYKLGFGQASGEYWLGLQNIFLLTQKKPYRLRVDLEAFDNEVRHVTYNSFALSPLAVNPDEDGYTLHIDGFKEGDPERPAGDSLHVHNKRKFSTHDRHRFTSCAVTYHGAFWYSSCYNANLNGKYWPNSNSKSSNGIIWYSWKTSQSSLKRTEMKIAPSGDSSKQ